MTKMMRSPATSRPCAVRLPEPCDVSLVVGQLEALSFLFPRIRGWFAFEAPVEGAAKCVCLSKRTRREVSEIRASRVSEGSSATGGVSEFNGRSPACASICKSNFCASAGVPKIARESCREGVKSKSSSERLSVFPGSAIVGMRPKRPCGNGTRRASGAINSEERPAQSHPAGGGAPLESELQETAAKHLSAQGPSEAHKDIPNSLIGLNATNSNVEGTAT